MTKKEMIEIFEQKGWWVAQKENLTTKQAEEVIKLNDAVDFALSILNSINKEQVGKTWKGEWEPGNPICPVCGKDKFKDLDADIWADWMPNFCPNCGAPMTDEAVEIVRQRLEGLL